MAWQDDSQGGGCCGRSRQHRIRPLPGSNTTSHMVEVRHKRVLRVQHINARPRDARFEKEMQVQQLYKSRGLHAGVVHGGPLVIPQKKSTPGGSVSHAQTPLPNSVADKAGGDTNTETLQDRLSSATGKTVSLTSPSGVEVAVKDGARTETGTVIPGDNEDHMVSTEHGKTLVSENTESLMVANQQNGTESQSHHESSEPHTVHKSVSQPVMSADDYLASTLSSAIQSPFTSPVHSQSGQSGPSHPPYLLFFIHGVGGSSDIWHSQMQCFAQEGYEIVAPDLIGHGMSCAPRNARAYHFSEICADMEELFDKYCKRKNVIIGHSYGCSFAVVLARRRSRRVHKLVLVSGGAPTPLAPQPGIFMLPTCMLGCLRPCLNCGFKKSAFHTQPVSAEEAFAIPTYVLQHTMNGQDWPDGDEVYHQWLLCPTLLIYGAQDKLVSLKEEKHMAEVIFRSQLEVIQDASHMVMIEAPDKVNALIRDFITEEDIIGANNPPQPLPDERSVSCMSNKSTKTHKAMPASHLQG